MVKKSLVSHIFSFLAYVKLVPGLKSPLADRFGLCAWMVAVALGSGVRFYFVLDYLNRIQTVANKITATIMILLIPVYTLLIFPLLSYAVGKTRDLVQNPDLPRPKNMAQFIAMVLLTLWVVVYSVIYIIKGYMLNLKLP